MTPQQQAGLIARKCADEWYPGKDMNTPRQHLTEHITDSLHLVQLLECVEALKLLAKINEQLNHPSLTPIAKDRFELIRNALTNLDRAMTGEKV